ncbi:MAG: hypothetical protein ABIZ91_09875 [Gemmatimonadaceae bacterium]
MRDASQQPARLPRMEGKGACRAAVALPYPIAASPERSTYDDVDVDAAGSP